MKWVAILVIILLVAGCAAGGYLYMQESDKLKEAQSDINSLQSNVSSLQTEYEAVSEELASIKEVYPPRHFESEDELRDWRESVGLLGGDSLPDAYLKLQEMALSDGYIVSVRLYQSGGTWWIGCIALAGNSFYGLPYDSFELLFLRDVD